MDAIAAGDEGAFARLVAGEAPRLLRFLSGLLGNVAEAEEITQESLLRLWRQAPDWRPVARIGTWLHHIAYRQGIDLLRKRRPSVDLDDVADSLADPADPPDRAFADGRRSLALADAIAALPERQRAAILLAHVQGLSQAEGALAMELSEAAYESLLARGRRRLKTAMAAWTEATPRAGGLEG